MKNIDASCYWDSGTTCSYRVENTFGDYSLFQNSDTILDWGCSDGRTTREIVENCFAKVYGIDQYYRRIGDVIGKGSNKRLKFFLGDGFSYLQEKEKKFDLVLAMNNILYILNKNNEKNIINSLGELVNNNGKLIFAATFGTWSSEKNKQGVYIILNKKNDRLNEGVFQKCELRTMDYILKNCPDFAYVSERNLFEIAKKNMDFLVEKYF